MVVAVLAKGSDMAAILAEGSDVVAILTKDSGWNGGHLFHWTEV